MVELEDDAETAAAATQTVSALSAGAGGGGAAVVTLPSTLDRETKQLVEVSGWLGSTWNVNACDEI